MKLRDDDAYLRRKLIERHGEMSEAGMTRAMLDYIVEVHLTEPPDIVEKSNRRGRSRGESREGDWMLDAFTYARQVRRQMKAEGKKGYYNWDAARDAAAHLKERDPYFKDYENLADAVFNGLHKGL